MKHRSLENQYRMLEAFKTRFDAVEVPVPKTGFARARELAGLAAELRAELTEGELPWTAGATGSTSRAAESPSVSSVQPGLWEEAEAA